MLPRIRPWTRNLSRHCGFPALCKGSAFTVTELLVALGIIAVLSALLLPNFKHVREEARTTECLTKLRWIGNELVTYAADNQGWVKVTAENRWYTYIPGITNAIKQPNAIWATANFNKIGCTGAKVPPGISETYGLFLNTQTHDGLSRKEEVPAGGRMIWAYSDRILMRSDRSSYAFLGDVAGSDGKQGGYFYTRTEGEGWLRLCVRHGGKANIWFADGHVEACNEDRLRAVNVRYVRDNEGKEKRL